MTPYERARGLVTQLATVLDELSAMPAVMRVLAFGSRKHPGSPWRAMAASEHFVAAQRHMGRWFSGQRIDDESGEPHLAHAIARLLFVLAIDERNS